MTGNYGMRDSECEVGGQCVPQPQVGCDMRGLESSTSIPRNQPSMPKPVASFCEFIQKHRMDASAASMVVYQVHEDLRLVRGWCDLRISLGSTVCVLGCAASGYDSVFPGESGPDADRTQAVVPLSKDVALTPRSLFAICNGIRHPTTQEKFRCVTLAIVDSDSTTAYYRVFNDFDEIVHPQWKSKKAKGEAQPGDDGGDDLIQGDSGSESGDLGSEDSD